MKKTAPAPQMGQLISMPTPLDGQEWSENYFALWKTLIEAQIQMCEFQKAALGAQLEMMKALERNMKLKR